MTVQNCIYLKSDRVCVNNRHIILKFCRHLHWGATITAWVFLIRVFDTVVHKTNLGKKSCVIYELV